MMIIPIYIYYGKNKFMFQSTNQMGISRSHGGTLDCTIFFRLNSGDIL
jgi:hypothetical protein